MSTLRVPISKAVAAYAPRPAVKVATDAKNAPKARKRRPGAIRPNAGLEVAYRRAMMRLIDDMDASVRYWVAAAYRANEPEVAQLAKDELPAAALLRVVRVLAKRWLRRFEAMAPKLAAWFAKDAGKRSDAALRKILRDGGMSVRFKLTDAERDVMKATVAQNVALIKSIPAQYFGQVEQSVMRSVAAGRDLGGLAKELQAHYGVTKRRAAFIARSQNNLATASLTRSRQLDVGITQAVWMHSGGGKEPRPTHVKAGLERQVYDVSKGWYDPHEKKHIWPGELPNCRCVCRPIVKGFS